MTLRIVYLELVSPTKSCIPVLVDSNEGKKYFGCLAFSSLVDVDPANDRSISNVYS